MTIFHTITPKFNTTLNIPHLFFQMDMYVIYSANKGK